MTNIKFSFHAMSAAILLCCLTSCESDDLIGGSKTISRFDLANGQALTMVGSSSRATDGDFSSAGMFKLGDDGQLTAIGVFVDEDGKESRSDLTVSPAAVYNLTDDYIGFEYCSYFDKDGDPVEATDEYRNLIVRRSDGLVFSAKGIGGSDYPTFNPMGASFTEDGAGRLLAAFYTFTPANPGYIGRITLTKGKGTWEQLSTDGSPIQYSDYPKVFAMSNGLVGMTVGCNPEDTYTIAGNSAGIIYPNGGYDTFGKYNGNTSCLVLDDAILELSNEQPKYIHLGTSYGESTVEVLPHDELLSFNYGLRSWYETSDKVIFNKCLDKRYVAFDKHSKRTTAIELQYDDNIFLWKENLCSDGRFYGIAKENGRVCKAVSFDPVTFSYTEKDLNIANEIDITYIANDSRNAKAQMTGTRRSDGYKVAVSVDLKTAQTDIIFSDPNRAIISLIPLN